MKNKTIKLAAVFAITLFAIALLPSVQALTFPRSVNVAVVPDALCSNGGGLYTGSNWPDTPPQAGFTFTNLQPATIANGGGADPLPNYDTVVLMATDFDFAAYWGDSDFSSRITSFINAGGKLIIYTSESGAANEFAGFIYPFTVDTPGQTGSFSGTVVNVADDTLSSSNAAADTYPNGLGSYVNLALLTSQTDAVGDLTVMTSVDSHWYIDMTGINVRGVGGPAHTYAFYGAGLIIWNGFDVDYTGNSYPPNNSNGMSVLSMIWWRELCGQTLGPGQSVSGLTLTPATATNNVGTTHTVTATVKDTINNPIPNVVVTFTITSGPNAGTTGQATTDANGQATFSWSSSTIGTDTVQASALNAAGLAVTTTATKEWTTTQPPGVPELPGFFGIFTAISFILLIAFRRYTSKKR